MDTPILRHVAVQNPKSWTYFDSAAFPSNLHMTWYEETVMHVHWTELKWRERRREGGRERGRADGR